MRHYDREIREIVITDHGRSKPTFIITNALELDAIEIVQKYAKRWLIEQEISEQIDFFHLNSATSSIVVKVDFDLTLTLLAHNLYRLLTSKLKGFEKCECATIFRKFIENGASVKIKNGEAQIALKKKSHLPLLFSLPWMKQKTLISWLDIHINFVSDSTS